MYSGRLARAVVEKAFLRKGEKAPKIPARTNLTSSFKYEETRKPRVPSKTDRPVRRQQPHPHSLPACHLQCLKRPTYLQRPHR